MKKVIFAGRACIVYDNPDAEYLLIQPIDEHDLEVLDQEVEAIRTLSDKPFSLVAFKIEDWNQELSPWPAPPVLGKIPFGDGAGETLSYILDQLLPALQEQGFDTSHCLLGGYSLAGLFLLWAAYQTNRFEAIAAASPSVWFPRWIEYASDKKPFADAIYLSLGDKEEKARNQLMAQVGNAIRRQHEILTEQGVKTILEWNPGNHFADSDKRTAKAFAWLLNNRWWKVVPTKEALEFDEVRLDIFIVGGKTLQTVGIHGLFANPQERLLLHLLIEWYMLHVTPKYLSKCVKNESGRVPLDHIHEMTVSIIRQQLRYSNKSIKEISADLDFPNLSFFGKFVKEHLGMSPTEYRQRNLREG